MYTILKSKLRPPAVRWAVVERAPMLLRLDVAAADPALRVLLLTAAAGYSKTTVLADWTRRLRARGVPVAWYSLGPGDRALTIFCSYLKAAFYEAVPGFATAFEQACAPRSADEVLPEEEGDALVGMLVTLTPLLAGLEGALATQAPGHDPDAPRLVIVLDDVHHIAGTPTLDTALSFLIRHLPVGVVLVLSARRDLGRGLPLARLRQGHHVVSLHEADLRLLPAEAARAYPDLAALAPHSAALDSLVQTLDGWPAGLALLYDRLVEAGRQAVDTQVTRRAREDLYSYLEEEVLSSVSEPLYSFLLRAAVLEELAVPACNALTGLTGSDVLLDQALHHHLFLTRTRIDPPAYTFHPLFRDFLLRRLEQMYGAGERRRLHHLAAAYAAGEKNWPRAAHHFLAAGDLEAVLMAVEAVWKPAPDQPALDPAALGAILRDAGAPDVRRRLVEALAGRLTLEHLPLLDAFAADSDATVQAAAQQARQALTQRAQGLLRIQMFGGLQIWHGATPVEARAWRRRRARLLLIYLLLAGPDGASRAQIAEKVWPDAQPAEASAQFYAHLRALREVLEPTLAPGAESQYISSRRGRYAFNFGAPHQWDLADFHQHREAGRRAERLGQPALAIPAYTAALACYEGALLPEPDLTDIPWLIGLREACREDVLAMHLALGEYAAADGAWEKAVRHWQALVALAPTREDVHLRLMRVFGWLGRRDAALAQFQAARTALIQAGGSEPGAALQDLYTQLVNNLPVTRGEAGPSGGLNQAPNR
jgi:DNA-binding SARP family transcriptional activator